MTVPGSTLPLALLVALGQLLLLMQSGLNDRLMALSCSAGLRNRAAFNSALGFLCLLFHLLSVPFDKFGLKLA